MTRWIVIIPIVLPRWVPPGIDPAGWHRALLEDAVDLLATLAEVSTGIAVKPTDRTLADAVAWPDTRVFELAELTIGTIFSAAETAGYEQAALLAPDAPDLPAMLIGKLLRPLTSRPMALAPAHTGGLLGLAMRLPMPGWLPTDLPADLWVDDQTVMATAPSPGLAARTAGWHRLTGHDGLTRLDVELAGWEATRGLLSAA